jgi:peptidoglycan/LPS O-acetylase OafA/YrhL
MVAWYHFTNGNPSLLPDGSPLKLSGKYGWLGVEIFFVISGFVIPYALHRGGYRLANFWRFVLKRIIRLDPPYLASIAVVLSLGALVMVAPGFRGEPLRFSWIALLLHLGYVNVLFGYPWLNPVYWTLAIEFQYYLIVGLSFPSLATGRKVFLIALTIATLSAFLVRAPELIFKFLPLFGLGVLTFRFKVLGESRTAYLLTCLALTAASYLSLGLPEALAGLIASTMIAFVRIDSRAGRFFGDISYSLYLLHVPVGGKVVNLFTRFSVDSPLRPLAPFVALALSVGAAYLLFLAVERPARRWSSALAYSRGAREGVVTEPAL